MVYTGGKEVVRELMASGPERSKPLHNFTLPLKWGNQRFLKCVKVDSNAGAASSDHRLRRRSASFEFGRSSAVINSGGSESEMIRREGKPNDRNFRFRTAASGSGDDDGEEGIDQVREKIMSDLRTVVDKMTQSMLIDEVSEVEEEVEETVGKEIEETEEKAIPKVNHREKGKEKVKKREETPAPAPEPSETVRPWNLRTRRSACKILAGDDGNNGVNKINNSKGLKIEDKRSNYSPLKTEAAKSPMTRERERERGGAPAEKQRPKFSISLTKKEIEEDFIAITGHRPPRRPKKRPKSVQRQLDTLFPGMWLGDITADSYKVPECPENGKK